MLRGQIEIAATDAAAVAPRYVDHLAARLRAARPARLEVDAMRVRVEGGMFRMVEDWYLLAGVTEATLVVAPTGDVLTVSYRISTMKLALACAALTVMGIVFSLNGLRWSALLWPLVWLGAYRLVRMNVEDRIVKLLGQTADEVVGTEPQPRVRRSPC
jgi:hypothetical protein